MSVPAAPLLSVEGLEVTFGTDAPAVCGVDLAVRSGQTVAVVGESGSGKSTTAAAILGLLPAGGRITAGRVVFDGRDITGADAKRLRSIRGREIGYVPQDPMTNLNPVWKVGFQVTEALRANTDGRAARRRAVELLAEAGLPDPAKQAGRYPHQLSGGMCQRALIAIGLAGRPRLLIADEPTSALDVTVQRQVLDHLQGLTDELGTALLLITHDLALAAQRAEAVVVVRRGVVVESGAAQSILQSPQHEYTRRLVAAAPSLTARSRRPPESRSRATTQAGDILVVSELTKIYRESRGAPWRRVESRAVDGVSFRLPRASTLAIVGESGSGKSTLARMVLGLLQPTSGTVVFDGTYDVGALARDQVLAFRRRVEHPTIVLPITEIGAPDGDVLARYTVRRDEFAASAALAQHIVESHTGPIEYAATLHPVGAPSSGIGIVEGWRGTIVHRVEIDVDGRITRAKVVDPSWFNWPALPVAMADTIVPDFPLANKSFNQSYAGNDL